MLHVQKFWREMCLVMAIQLVFGYTLSSGTCAGGHEFDTLYMHMLSAQDMRVYVAVSLGQCISACIAPPSAEVLSSSQRLCAGASPLLVLLAGVQGRKAGNATAARCCCTTTAVGALHVTKDPLPHPHGARRERTGCRRLALNLQVLLLAAWLSARQVAASRR